MDSNISAPSNIISLEPTARTSESPRPTPPALQKNSALARLADSDFPEAVWNLGGIFLYDNAFTLLYEFAYENFERHNDAISEFHGAPPCSWTLDWFQARPLISPGKIAARLKKLSVLPGTFVLTLDNPFVPAELIGDAIGNTLLTGVSRLPRAAVAVASDALAAHIRRRFPGIRLRAGLNKVVAENGRGNVEYYKKAAAQFSVVAIHSDDLFNLPLLEELAKSVGAEKFELTVNDSCVRDCPVRSRHLESLAKIRKSPWAAEFLRERHALLAKARCEEVAGKPGANVPRAALLTRDELKKIYALGFRRFRLQAETLRSEFAFFWSAASWLLSTKPENWHFKALAETTMITKIVAEVEPLPNGLSPFVTRKYD